MANLHLGKFLLLNLLFLFASPHISRVFVKSVSAEIAEAVEAKPDIDELSVLERHQIQLDKLEELVRNLTELVIRLESQASESKIRPVLGERHQSVERLSILAHEEKIKPADSANSDDGQLMVETKNDRVLDGVVQDGGRERPVSVTKYNPFWSERFPLVSAVKLNSDATCVNVLPFRDFEGLSKYFVIGDDQGRVFAFLRNGDVLAEFSTVSDSPITSMLSYMSFNKNELILVTGHSNGLILSHRVREMVNGEDSTSLSMDMIGKFGSSDIGEVGSPVTVLEVHHVGRLRYILSSDASGKIRVTRENGTVYGLAVPTSRPIAFLKQRLLFLTETGAGSLDLRTMRIRESECEGLNRSSVVRYVFDVTEKTKAYGFTSEGDLIHVLLLGDIANFKCRVRSKRKSDIDHKPIAFQAIKGYLLIVNDEKVFVYNVSSHHYTRAGAPRLVFSAGLDEIRSSFLNYQTADVDGEIGKVIPLLASDSEKLVILGLGGGYVGMYRSNLPVFKGEFNTILWTSPVFIFILFLFGAWHFFAKKKEALISWGPDDPFINSSITNGAPGVATDRSFTESSSRGGDVLSSGLRGPSRRYVSPSRYPGGGASSFRPSATDNTNPRPSDPNFRASSSDPNFRTPSELKYRGSNLEPTGFHKRRDSLYADDSN